MKCKLSIANVILLMLLVAGNLKAGKILYTDLILLVFEFQEYASRHRYVSVLGLLLGETVKV